MYPPAFELYCIISISCCISCCIVVHHGTLPCTHVRTKWQKNMINLLKHAEKCTVMRTCVRRCTYSHGFESHRLRCLKPAWLVDSSNVVLHFVLHNLHEIVINGVIHSHAFSRKSVGIIFMHYVICCPSASVLGINIRHIQQMHDRCIYVPELMEGDRGHTCFYQVSF